MLDTEKASVEKNQEYHTTLPDKKVKVWHSSHKYSLNGQKWHFISQRSYTAELKET